MHDVTDVIDNSKLLIMVHKSIITAAWYDMLFLLKQAGISLTKRRKIVLLYVILTYWKSLLSVTFENISCKLNL